MYILIYKHNIYAHQFKIEYIYSIRNEVYFFNLMILFSHNLLPFQHLNNIFIC